MRLHLAHLFVKVIEAYLNELSAVRLPIRPSKPDKNSEELLAADNQVERYKDVLEKIVKKFAPTTGSSVGGVSLPGSGSSSNSGGLNGDGPLDAASREKRCKKLHEYRLAQAMEESSSALPGGLLRDVLENCGECNEIYMHNALRRC